MAWKHRVHKVNDFLYNIELSEVDDSTGDVLRTFTRRVNPNREKWAAEVKRDFLKWKAAQEALETEQRTVAATLLAVAKDLALSIASDSGV